MILNDTAFDLHFKAGISSYGLSEMTAPNEHSERVPK